MKGSRWARIHIKWVGSTKRMGLGFWDKKDFERCILLESTRISSGMQPRNAGEHNGSGEILYIKLALPSSTLVAF